MQLTHEGFHPSKQPGTLLFLYNFSARVLYGVFEALGEPGMDICPSAWTGR